MDYSLESYEQLFDGSSIGIMARPELLFREFVNRTWLASPMQLDLDLMRS